MGDTLYRQYEDACRLWPEGVVAEDYRDPVRSSVPALLFSGEWDPVTPPSWGEEVAEHLSNSLHVVVPEAGHGVAGPCISRIESQFVNEATAKNLDTSCIARRR
jgi:pimeloyl-ACP methyl ester carboxylesterase